jgi:hypothetical protein
MGKKNKKKAREALVVDSKPNAEERIMAALSLAYRVGRLTYFPPDGPELNVKTPEGWVDGWPLCHPYIGGSDGLRRLRALWQAGRVEHRPHPNPERTDRQYRLLSLSGGSR